MTRKRTKGVAVIAIRHSAGPTGYGARSRVTEPSIRRSALMPKFSSNAHESLDIVHGKTPAHSQFTQCGIARNQAPSGAASEFSAHFGERGAAQRHQWLAPRQRAGDFHRLSLRHQHLARGRVSGNHNRALTGRDERSRGEWCHGLHGCRGQM